MLSAFGQSKPEFTKLYRKLIYDFLFDSSNFEGVNMTSSGLPYLKDLIENGPDVFR